MPRLRHFIGTRFGRLAITARAGTRISCRCDCGAETVVSLANLTTGHTTSCGCARRETTVSRSLRHGAARRKRHTRAYETWCGMLKRCRNPNSRDWPNYGGRGITVDERWLRFENFLADMGDPPARHSIERKERNGPYCKDNCIWATRRDQNRNTRRNRFLTSRGRTQTLQAWADEIGINHTSLLGRLRRGWDIDRALSEGSRA
jgi:hypothetical protein